MIRYISEKNRIDNINDCLSFFSLRYEKKNESYILIPMNEDVEIDQELLDKEYTNLREILQNLINSKLFVHLVKEKLTPEDFCGVFSLDAKAGKINVQKEIKNMNIYELQDIIGSSSDFFNLFCYCAYPEDV